ncbi:Uncharacterised protein [Serratia rubidaea]|uniref:Uncharacterized protein n=1 Tax=Serratia rubidaea TaxID=61652 RepID=A0A3S4FSB7_SERRU|nr:Uncharacterised protein [Serratia rubidaea]
MIAEVAEQYGLSYQCLDLKTLLMMQQRFFAFDGQTLTVRTASVYFTLIPAAVISMRKIVATHKQPQYAGAPDNSPSQPTRFHQGAGVFLFHRRLLHQW